MREDKSDYSLRPATASDVEALLRLTAACPDALPELWDGERLATHQRAFPDGQLVVEREGELVAAALSLVVTIGREPHRDHSWVGVTDDGWFRNHDPFGDTLYGAHLVVHPQHRRRGLGRRLYAARQRLARRLNVRRILVPGRLCRYAAREGGRSADEHARRVEAGEASDPLLEFQLAQGYVLKKVIPHYRRDEASRDHAALLEWTNPHFVSRGRKTQSIRVSCVQYRMRKLLDFEQFARQVRYFVDVAAGYGADFVVFPELLTAQLMSFIDVKTPLEAIRRLTDYTDLVDTLFTDLAREYQVGIVGGTHPIRRGELIENVASLYLPDGVVHRQPKLHVTPNEHRSWGIAGGSSLKVFRTPKARVGILICYDVEFPETARYLAEQGAEVIFVPFCTDDRQSYLRVRYCAQARAVENQVYLAMAGTVGNLPDTENMDIQYAQSAVLSPSDFPFARDGILVEASVNTETIITTDLDFEALEEAIGEGTVRPRLDRRPDLFSFTAHIPPAPQGPGGPSSPAGA